MKFVGISTIPARKLPLPSVHVDRSAATVLPSPSPLWAWPGDEPGFPEGSMVNPEEISRVGNGTERVFAKDGPLSRVLAPSHEWRPQQGGMALAVSRALCHDGRLLVEAPTGVGKSLAYLVPGILWAIEAGRPILVSTFTRSLQDQILDKDLPHARRLIERRFRAIVLKGRSNYLCRNRWAYLLGEIQGTVEGEDLERTLGYWVQTTETGDLSDAPVPVGSRGSRIRSLMPRIAGETRFCSTPRCTADNGCFFRKSRQDAKGAHLVIVNHSLLLIDIFQQAAGLPEWSAAIIDEAHHLPGAAVDPLSLSVSENSLEAAIKGLGGRGEPGLTDQLRRVLRGHPGKVDQAEQQGRIRLLEEETGSQLLAARSFWADLKEHPAFPGKGHLRYGPGAEIRDLFPPSAFALCTRLEVHLDRLTAAVEEIRALSRGRSEDELRPLLEAARHMDQARAEVLSLGALLDPDRTGYIYWIDPSGGGGATLRAAPVDVGSHLRGALFRPSQSVVLTSATLAVDGRFEHLARSLGLEDDGYEGLPLDTPFRLEEQVQAWAVSGAPDPGDPKAADSLAAGIEAMAARLRRKMLVLFTSHEALRKVEAIVRVPLEDRGIRLLAQGVDGGRRKLRSGFSGGGPAVLLGAASFWEGVDFPGEELEILVMARLPFLVPTDPLVEARAQRTAEEGRDPFRDFHLPEALIRFRQGFGRLIRRRTDRGIFVVADPRILTRSYGRRFCRSIGMEFRTASSWEELADAAAGWLQNPAGLQDLDGEGSHEGS